MAEPVGRGEVLADRFRLTEPFAEDPLLEVWRAEDLQLQRDVVIQVLLPRWMDDEEIVGRFRSEAQMAAGLHHENVVRTFDVEESDGRLFSVSEYVPGPTVEQLLGHAPLAAPEVAAIGQQAASGLAAVHTARLVHGAVCPANLVVAPSGRLCLIDFGSVRPLDVADRLPDPVFPEPGVGDYWPPERREGAPPDERGDVYGLGLLQWEALTGGREVGTDPPRRPVRRLLAGLPGLDDGTPRLREILGGAVVEDPAERTRAADLADALSEICGERPQEELARLVAGQ